MNYPAFRDEMAPFPIVSVREIEKHFPGFDRRRLVEWQKKGYLKKLRNRFYYFSDQEIDASFLFYTANQLHAPSYISLASALSKYNFIPEGVFSVTSCSTLKTQSFETPASRFRYRHLKSDLYFGYQLDTWGDHHYLIAEPEKALIDYLYLHPDVSGTDDIASLRWNRAEIRDRITLPKLEEYQSYIHSPALSRRLTILKEFLHVAPE